MPICCVAGCLVFQVFTFRFVAGVFITASPRLTARFQPQSDEKSTERGEGFRSRPDRFRRARDRSFLDDDPCDPRYTGDRCGFLSGLDYIDRDIIGKLETTLSIKQKMQMVSFDLGDPAQPRSPLSGAGFAPPPRPPPNDRTSSHG